MEALSGRVQPTKVASTSDKQEDAPAVKERITAEELRDFLMKIDSTPAEAFLATNEEEICSQADMFVNNTHEIAKAKNRALRDTPGSKTHARIKIYLGPHLIPTPPLQRKSPKRVF